MGFGRFGAGGWGGLVGCRDVSRYVGFMIMMKDTNMARYEGLGMLLITTIDNRFLLLSIASSSRFL